MHIMIQLPEEAEFRKRFAERNDFEAMRMRRYLDMPDLSRTEGSPIRELVGRILKIPGMAGLDVITVPEIVPADVSFDLFNFSPDHPARTRSDTYYVDETHILRTHTTVMWYYYVHHPSIRERLRKGESVGALAYGKVYRKDEIDRRHMNVFHQIDGWGLKPKAEKLYTVDDLKEILADVAKAVFGPSVEYRFNIDSFPYTDPSCEMEVKKADGTWVEVLGSGLVHPNVLKSLDIDPEVYNGWAFGFGLERLAILSMALPDIRLLWSDDPRVKRQLKLGQAFKEVSKYPPVTRDVSFVVGKDFVPNNYFDIIREIGGNLVEEVQLLDRYEDGKKFGNDRVSYTYRIMYRSGERTLVSSEIDKIQDEIYRETARQFRAEIR